MTTSPVLIPHSIPLSSSPSIELAAVPQVEEPEAVAEDEDEDEDDQAVLVALADTDESRAQVLETVAAVAKSAQSESCAKESLLDTDTKMVDEFVVC